MTKDRADNFFILHPSSFLQKPVSFPRTVLRRREDLGALFGHENRMFKLRREAAVAGTHGPIIGFIHHRIALASVNHWLNGKA